MEKLHTIRNCKFFVALLLVGATHLAMASFTGSSEGKNKQFSLKAFNRSLTRTSANPFSLRSGFEYKGSDVVNLKKEANGTTSITSIMKYERGNTTYIYPYKHKVVVSKFATPKQPSIR